MKNRINVPFPKETRRNIKFSFEFYDNTGKYCISDWEKDKIKLTLGRLSDFCTKTYSDICKGANTYHFHLVDWSKTEEKNGFPNIKARNLEPFQFSLVGVNQQKARVFGAFYEDTFYIVWFDLEHKIWPSFRR